MCNMRIELAYNWSSTDSIRIYTGLIRSIQSFSVLLTPQINGRFCLPRKKPYSIVLHAIMLIFSMLSLKHIQRQLFCFEISFQKDTVSTAFCTWVAVRSHLKMGHCLWDYILTLLCLEECWSCTQHVTGVHYTEKS